MKSAIVCTDITSGLAAAVRRLPHPAKQLPPLHFEVDGGRHRVRFSYRRDKKGVPVSTSCFIEKRMEPIAPVSLTGEKPDWDVYGKATVRCCRGDAFDFEIGRRLALKKAIVDCELLLSGRDPRRAAWGAYWGRFREAPMTARQMRAEIARLHCHVAELLAMNANLTAALKTATRAVPVVGQREKRAAKKK